MSRIHRFSNNAQVRQFFMQCDEPDCNYEEGPGRCESDLPLVQFALRGWFIAPFYGDCCPRCRRAGKSLGRQPMPFNLMRYPDLSKEMQYDLKGISRV